MPETPATRKLKIVSCSPVHTGEKNGKPYTVYEIKATTPDGAPIPPDMKLRSFTELPLGEVVEVEVKKFEGTHGISYTLQPKKGQTGARVNELTQRVEALEQVIKGLADRLTAVEQRPPVAAQPAPAAALPGVPSVAAAPGGDDDIPF